MSIKQKVIKGTFWNLMERLSTHVVTFGVGIVLARLLSPADYGQVALLTIFTSIAGVLADSGFGSALIQKKNATELDFNSVFYFSLGITLVLYLILFMFAPTIAEFYKNAQLCPILRVMAITLFFNAINSVQNAELTRKMLFNLSFRISLISTFTSAFIGVALALLGYGVWALVWMNIAGGAVGVISRWVIIAWRPRIMFSRLALVPLFKYGWKMSVSGLLNTGFSNLNGLVIGKFYSGEDLSFVNRGMHIPQMLMSNIVGTIDRVSFPVLAQKQDERHVVREIMRRMLVVTTFAVFPLMMLLAVTAKNTIIFIYGQKWVNAVPYAVIGCFGFALWPFHRVNLQGIQAIGRSDVFLKLEVIKKIFGVLVLLVFIPKGVMHWCLAETFIGGVFYIIVNSLPNRKLLGYTLAMQMQDVLPSILVCIAISLPLCLINLLQVSSQMARVGVIVAQGIVAVTLYLLISFAFRLRGMCEFAAIIRTKMLPMLPFLNSVFKYLEK